MTSPRGELRWEYRRREWKGGVHTDQQMYTAPSLIPLSMSGCLSVSPGASDYPKEEKDKTNKPLTTRKTNRPGNHTLVMPVSHRTPAVHHPAVPAAIGTLLPPKVSRLTSTFLSLALTAARSIPWSPPQSLSCLRSGLSSGAIQISDTSWSRGTHVCWCQKHSVKIVITATHEARVHARSCTSGLWNSLLPYVCNFATNINLRNNKPMLT